MEIKLILTFDEVMQLGNIAAERPYKEVGALLQKMERQVNEQVANQKDKAPE